MATELPPIGLGAATGVDAAGPSERVQDWTEHEVAEWAAFGGGPGGARHARKRRESVQSEEGAASVQTEAEIEDGTADRG